MSTNIVDADGDGKVDKYEMKAALKFVTIRADHLYWRMRMEQDLAVMLAKLPLFVLCLSAFLVGLIEFAPPAATADIHRHIRAKFDSDAIDEIKDFEGIYEYMLTFSKANAEFQAASTNYWCERRYWRYVWDADLSVPRRICVSPRQYALTLSTDPSWSWVSLNASGSLPEDENASCEDDDGGLQSALGHEHATCANYPHACEIELGLTLCPKSCGYCAPWKYEWFHHFPNTQVTMLPAMVYQTRFGATACHGFAHIYDLQPTNPALWQLPPLDGPRNGPLLYCMDRSTHIDDTYALELECPEDAPAEFCPPGGTFRVTHKDSFHGMTIYPKLLSEPKHHVDQLRAVEWLDVQTETVAVSTMVYTEGTEVFTSVAVEFSVSEAGNIDASFSVVSYKDLINGTKTKFVASMITTSVGALLGVLLSARHIQRHRRTAKLGLEIYELFSRGLLLVFPVYLLITWSQQKPMRQEYDEVLHTFLDMPGGTTEDLEKMIHHFFEVKTHIYAEVTWMKAQRVAAYVVLYFQFMQLILYMGAHPKLGVLSDTVNKAAVHLIHFSMLFGSLFLMIGFMAHWMLGGQIPSFASFQSTLRSQVQMLFGEFIHIDGADKLSSSYTVMYWIYAATFGIIVFFTLLNFFLAIIVDAFVAVKKAAGAYVILGDIFTDVRRVLHIRWKWRRKRWPARDHFTVYFHHLIKELEKGSFVDKLEHEDDDGPEPGQKKVTVTPEELMENVEGLTEEQLAAILAYYFELSPEVLCARGQSGGAPQAERDTRCQTGGAPQAASGSPEPSSPEGPPTPSLPAGSKETPSGSKERVFSC